MALREKKVVLLVGCLHRLDRRIDLEYLDMGEFAELCSADFELGVVRNGLSAAVETYDPQKQMVVLWVAACGFLGVLTVPIVPDFGVCKQLGADHAQQRTLQLALDVVDEQVDEAALAAAQAEMAKAEQKLAAKETSKTATEQAKPTAAAN